MRLHQAGKTQREIAAMAGCSEMLVSYVVAGTRQNKKIQALIANAIGICIDIVFPANNAPCKETSTRKAENVNK